MEKQTFVKSVKELLDCLDTLFLNYLSNLAEHGLELAESEHTDPRYGTIHARKWIGRAS